MFKVNLIPWREKYKRSRQNAFYKVIAACFVVGLVAGGGFYYYQKMQLDDAKERLASIEQRKKALETQLAKFKALQDLEAQLRAKLAALQLLKDQRFLMAERLNKLPTLMNEGVMLETIQSNEEGLVASGLGLDEFSVSSLMRTLDSSDVFSGSSVSVLSKVNRSREVVLPGQAPSVDLLQFNLNVQNQFGGDVMQAGSDSNG